MKAADGKGYLTDVADTEQILRLIQSVPSKKAEPFKLWLAKVGSERIDETVDPEISIERTIHAVFRHEDEPEAVYLLTIHLKRCIMKHER